MEIGQTPKPIIAVALVPQRPMMFAYTTLHWILIKFFCAHYQMKIFINFFLKSAVFTCCHCVSSFTDLTFWSLSIFPFINIERLTSVIIHYNKKDGGSVDSRINCLRTWHGRNNTSNITSTRIATFFPVWIAWSAVDRYLLMLFFVVQK